MKKTVLHNEDNGICFVSGFMKVKTMFPDITEPGFTFQSCYLSWHNLGVLTALDTCLLLWIKVCYILLQIRSF